MSYKINDAVEEWRLVPGWPSFEVSSYGIVRFAVDGYRKKAGYVLKPWRNRTRLQVELRANRSRKKFFVHQLVVAAFIGSAPSDEHEIAHWDGDTENNYVKNLRWATSLENSADRDRHGRTARGEMSGPSRLVESQVRQIISLCSSGTPQQKVAKKFGVSKHTVWCIANKRTWKHITEAA
jgi:hypothetical protein